jgi:RNA polymerase sigma-70 factor, ECF subfamily
VTLELDLQVKNRTARPIVNKLIPGIDAVRREKMKGLANKALQTSVALGREAQSGDMTGQVGRGDMMATSKKTGRASIVRPDEKELLELVKGGDRGAFRLLVESYQSSLFVCAFDIVKNRADAEDVVQESFVKAYLSLDKFRGLSSFYTWIYRITLNMAIDFRRKVARRGGDSYEFDETWGKQPEGSLNGDPAHSILVKERLQELQSALSSLSDEHRMVITLREVEGMSYDEIASSLGVSVGTVMSRLHYGRKNLQQNLSYSVGNSEEAKASVV